VKFAEDISPPSTWDVWG